jgi:hypothetical protein
MSLTSQISSTEASFKLSQKIVSALAEKFSFKFEDGWSAVSNRPLELIQKRLRREKRRANPASAVKHARTAFSFFTQKQRPVSQAAHPEASFGQLSRFVSEAWKALTPEQMTEFKTLETADKERYQKERAAVLAALPTDGEAVVAVEAAAEPVKEKKVRKVKSAEAAPAVPAEPVVAAAPAKKAKVVKAEAAAPAAEVAAPVEAAAPAKKAKTPKAAAAPVVAEVAAPAPVAEAKAVKAPKAKSTKA